MSTVQVKDLQGTATGQIALDPACLETRQGDQAVHEAVVAFMANQRQGTASTLTRGEVAGGGRKPWRQKGTGRARHGSIRSPIWRHGGISFGPRPRDYRQRIPKAVRRLAFRRAFSDCWTSGRVSVVEGLAPETPRTREIAALLDRLGLIERPLLILVEQASDNLLLATRNLPQVRVVEARSAHLYDLLRPRSILMTRTAVEVIAQRLGGSVTSVETTPEEPA